MKYIIETISIHRNVHVVEASDEAAALSITEYADPNWEEHLGVLKVDATEFTEEHIKHFREKRFFWDGVAYRDANGQVDYIRPPVVF